MNKQYFIDNGRRGGKKTAERGPEYYREIGKKGIEARRAKKKNKL